MGKSKAVSLFVSLGCWCCLLVGALAVRKPSEYTVDLDVPEDRRWNEVLAGEENTVRDLNNIMKQIFGPTVLPGVEKIVADLDSHLPSPFAGEIKGIAQYLNISVGEVLLLNIFYDISAWCTSIVSVDSGGNMWHARNMDYNWSKQLEDMTILVHFTKGGKRLYSAVTFASYVGVSTAQKDHFFTLSQDERDKGSFWDNLHVALTDKHAAYSGFLGRDVMENADSFEEALTQLSTTDTIAPGYFILGGARAGEGAVITRNRTGTGDIRRMQPTNGSWYLVQTNYDHWNQPPPEDDRRNPAIKMMEEIGQKGVTKETLFQLLSTPPVQMNITIFSTIMSASQPGVMEVWIRDN